MEVDHWSSLFDFPVPGPTATCPHLMLDENKGEPRNFRSPRFFSPPVDTKIDFRGFCDLPISANAQCGDNGWKIVVERIRTEHNGIIVNMSMRQESYAYIRLKEGENVDFPADVEPSVGFMPVSWFTHNGGRKSFLFCVCFLFCLTKQKETGRKWGCQILRPSSGSRFWWARSNDSTKWKLFSPTLPRFLRARFCSLMRVERGIWPKRLSMLLFDSFPRVLICLEIIIYLILFGDYIFDLFVCFSVHVLFAARDEVSSFVCDGSLRTSR
jgi:hypothetical protein